MEEREGRLQIKDEKSLSIKENMSMSLVASRSDNKKKCLALDHSIQALHPSVKDCTRTHN